MVPIRFILSLAVVLLTSTHAAVGAEDIERAVTVQEPRGVALVDRLRKGGLVTFFRHADTRGMPCDRSFRVGDRDGQRNISADGQEQSRRIGRALRDLGVPVALPVLAGPVYRARDTAEIAFGPANVEVTDGLLADDYSGARLIHPCCAWRGQKSKRMTFVVQGVCRRANSHAGRATIPFAQPPFSSGTRAEKMRMNIDG